MIFWERTGGTFPRYYYYCEVTAPSKCFRILFCMLHFLTERVKDRENIDGLRRVSGVLQVNNLIFFGVDIKY